MKPPPLHILNERGRALCMGKRPAKLGTAPCPKCADLNAKKQARDRNRERREQERKERQAALTEGIVTQLASGNFALQYLLGGVAHTESLATKDEARAKMLAPLCMKRIRRTGRPLRMEPTCYADKQGALL